MFFKLFCHGRSNQPEPFISGIVHDLVLNLRNKSNGLFNLPITEIGVGCKDASLQDWAHTDTMSNDLCRIFTVLNPEWDYENNGGSFILKNEEIRLKYGEFLVFDPGTLHQGAEVKGQNKRFTLDISLHKNLIMW